MKGAAILATAKEIFHRLNSTLLKSFRLEAQIEHEEDALVWRIKGDGISFPLTLQVNHSSRLGEKGLRKLLYSRFIAGVEAAVLNICYCILVLHLLNRAGISEFGKNYIWWKDDEVGEVTCFFFVKGRGWRWVVVVEKEGEKVYEAEIKSNRHERNPIEAFKRILASLSLCSL